MFKIINTSGVLTIEESSTKYGPYATYGLDTEDMECCWLVDGITREQVIEDMKALGATHEEFLNPNTSPVP